MGLEQHWIINFITHQQLKYPNISSTPTEVLSHLLFCNGNGHEIHEGNFVADVTDLGSKVKYSQLHLHQYDKNKSIERLNNLEFDYNVERVFDLKSRYLKDKDDNTLENLYSECVEEYLSRYDDIFWIDNLSVDKLKNVSFLKELILKHECAPYLHLSPKYYKSYYFNEHTDKDLVDITICLASAYIEVLSELLEGEHNNLKLLFKNISELKSVYTSDIKELKKLIKSLEKMR